MPTAAAEWQVNAGTFDTRQTPQLAVTKDGDAFAAYRNGAGDLILRRDGGESLVLNSEGKRPSGLKLDAFGNRLYAAWLELRQTGHPTLLLRASADGGADWAGEVIVDDTTRPLPRINLAGDSAGNLYVAWLGDPPDPPESDASSPNRPNYAIYARHSADGGRSWGEVQPLTTNYNVSGEHRLLLLGDIAYVFSGAQRDGKNYLIVTYTNGEGGWTEPAVIKEVGGLLLLEVQNLDNRLLAVWFGTYGDHYLLEGAVSEDGKQWRSFTFPGSKELDIGMIDLISRGQQAYLVFSARSAEKPHGPWKRTVYFTRSSDGGETWDEIRSLRHYPFDHTHAYFPQIAVMGDDAMIVVWNDYRNIRGDLYFNISENGGKEWLPYDVPLTERAATNDLMFPFIDALQCAGVTCNLLAARYPNDGHVQPDLFLHTFEPKPKEPSDDLINALDSPAKRDLLAQRVKAFWQALIEADYQTAYTLYDPFFRQRLREIDYLAMSGRVKHHGFEIKDIQVKGNIAKVIVDFVYEIPPLSLRLGGTYSRPKTRASIQETWLFIEDQWYKEYYSELGEFSFARY